MSPTSIISGLLFRGSGVYALIEIQHEPRSGCLTPVAITLGHLALLANGQLA